MANATLTIEGLPPGWDVSLRGSRAQHSGTTAADPTFLSPIGKLRWTCANSGQSVTALLDVGAGSNVVAFAEFRPAETKTTAKDAFAGAAVAAALTGVVYSARR